MDAEPSQHLGRKSPDRTRLGQLQPEVDIHRKVVSSIQTSSAPVGLGRKERGRLRRIGRKKQQAPERCHRRGWGGGKKEGGRRGGVGKKTKQPPGRPPGGGCNGEKTAPFSMEARGVKFQIG